MKRTIALSLCLAFVASVAFAFPFGMPPQENPLVTRVAPEDSGMFISWQGIGAADANSANRVEQSLTKPEVKATLKELKDSFLEKLGNRPLFAKFVDLAMRNGASFYVSDTKASSFAGMIALGPNDLSVVGKLTAATNALSQTGKFEVSNINIGALQFYKLSSGTEENDFYWGAFGKGRVIVFANSERALVTIISNARTAEPNWVVSAKRDFNIERLSTFSAIFGDFIAEGIEQNPASDETTPEMEEAQKNFLGISFVDKVVAASGLDDVGAVHKTAVYMKDGWKTSLPGIMIDKPLAVKDLSVIPSDAVFALAGKTDLNALFNAITQSEVVPDEIKMQITGMSIFITPFLSAMGDSWAFFTTEEDGVPGGALVWSLKNPALAKFQLNKLMEMLKNSMKTEVEIQEMGMNNRTVHVIPTQLNIFGADDDEDEDVPRVQVQVIPGGQIPNGAIPMQVFPGGQIPNGAIPMQVIPGGQIPNGAIPMGGGQFQLGGGGIDPLFLLSLLPESIEKIKIDKYDFWLLKRGEDNSNNIVIGIAGKNLIVTTKSYAEKYVAFDGAQNLSSNESVAKMMSSNPSYLIYTSQKSIPNALKGLAEQFVPGGADQYSSLIEAFSDSEQPVVVGVYSKDDSVRIDSFSGLPIPDWMTMTFLQSLGKALQ